jgi:hypothetical protein
MRLSAIPPVYLFFPQAGKLSSEQDNNPNRIPTLMKNKNLYPNCIYNMGRGSIPAYKAPPSPCSLKENLNIQSEGEISCEQK